MGALCNMSLPKYDMRKTFLSFLSAGDTFDLHPAVTIVNS